MKLSLLTYQVARHLELDPLIATAKRHGFAAIEFRAEAGHKHGVELETSAAQRKEIRAKLEDTYLAPACIGTSSRFESPDEKERRKMIDRTKAYMNLAADIDCHRVRVFGNKFPQGVDRQDCVRWVGECLHELGEHGEETDVRVGLEMHGDFNFWKYAQAAVDFADHPSVGIVYNCDPKDLVAGSCRETYSYVREYIIHVHLHDFDGKFPYKELFRLLSADHYDGYCSSEIEGEITDTDRVLSLYAQLFREWAFGNSGAL